MRVVAPADGRIVTGRVQIVATGAAVDPVQIDVSVDRGTTWRALPTEYTSGRWRATWDSGTYSGRAALRARSTVTGRRDAVSVIVDNTPPRVRVSARPKAFSPNSDGRRDATTVTVRSSERALVSISIRNRAGAVVRRWVARPTHGGVVLLWWAGRIGDRHVGDGVFRIRALARDRAGLAGRDGATTRVDTRRPALRIVRLARVIDASRAVRVRYRVADAARHLRLRARLYDAVGAVRQRIVVRPRGDGTLRLASRYRDGETLLPGNYRLVLTASDGSGNAGRVARRFVVHRQMRGRVYERLEGAGRRVALTFDDCHFGDSWTHILDTLRARRVKATFFCPGDMVERFPRQARRVVTGGHTAASHAWGHPFLTRLSQSAVRERLLRDRAAWQRAAGATSAAYFRPPYGLYNSSVVATAADTAHGRTVMWDIDSRDTAGATGSTLVCNVVCRARSGSIILLHTKPTTAVALPAIIRGLRDRGLEPVGLPQLFRAAGHH